MHAPQDFALQRWLAESLRTGSCELSNLSSTMFILNQVYR